MMATSFADYKEQRTQLIAQDRALRVDHVRAGSFTDVEIKADRVVRAIRAREAETIWSKEHDGVPKAFPGMDFLTGKSVIVKTELYEILRQMPKASRHSHTRSLRCERKFHQDCHTRIQASSCGRVRRRTRRHRQYLYPKRLGFYPNGAKDVRSCPWWT